MDLRFLFPLILTLLALQQLFSKSPCLNTAPWYILAWYAFDSFLKLNMLDASQKATKIKHGRENLVGDYPTRVSNDLHRSIEQRTTTS